MVQIEVLQALRERIKKEVGARLTVAQLQGDMDTLCTLAKNLDFRDCPTFLEAALETPRYMHMIADGLCRPKLGLFDGIGFFKAFEFTFLPDLIRKGIRNQSITVLCPNCGNGAEVYSLGLILATYQDRLPGWALRVIGLESDAYYIRPTAEEVLTPQVVAQVPTTHTHFVKGLMKTGSLPEVVQSIVSFQRGTLESWSGREEQINMIVMRHQLAFWVPKIQRLMISHCAKILHGDGVLALGIEESLMGLTQVYRPIEGVRGIYRQVA